MNKSHWFVEVDPVSNEHLSELLKHHGIGIDAEEYGRLDTDGRPHDVLSIPSEFVTRLRKAKKLDERRILHQFKFFVSSSRHGLIRSASFIEKRTRSKKVKQAMDDLEKLKIKQQ